jgi:6-phosphogluconolactonase
VTHVEVAATPQALTDIAAHRLRRLLAQAQEQRGRASAALSGGSAALGPLGSPVLRRDAPPLDASRLDLWWADERHVPLGHDERNDTPALVALGPVCPPDERLHRVAGTELTLDEAAADYDERLRVWVEQCAEDGRAAFEVALLGVGPDGHVASLFPGRDEADSPALAVAVPDSPKPPPQRVSLTLRSLGLAEEVWLLATGASKAQAVAAALAGDTTLPSARVRGRLATRWFLDAEAASELPPP